MSQQAETRRHVAPEKPCHCHQVAIDTAVVALRGVADGFDVAGTVFTGAQIAAMVRRTADGVAERGVAS